METPYNTMKITKKLKDEFKKITDAPTVSTIEPIDFEEFKTRKEREVVDVDVDFSKLKGALTIKNE